MTISSRLRSVSLSQVLSLLLGLLVIRVTISVVMKYPDYLPPDFRSAFLEGRESYFFGSYQWAFYLHIVSGPITLLLGLPLLTKRFLKAWPQWHRRLGKAQSLLVMLMVVPSGFWMAFYTDADWIAGTGFATLALATGVCVAIGWQMSKRRRFIEHQRWMWRCYVLLCSAVVLRLMASLALWFNLDASQTYAALAWISWLLPWLGFEIFDRIQCRPAPVPTRD